MIAGANENDYHLRNVTPGEDFKAEFFDLRQVAPGDTALETGDPLEIHKSVEIGHIFKLGYKYSEAMGLKVTERSRRGSDADHGLLRHRRGADSVRRNRVVQPTRTASPCLPSIAPFEVVITPVNYADAAQREAARRSARRMQGAGSRRCARRSRRASGREVQGRGSGRNSVPHHDRQEAGAGDRGSRRAPDEAV